MTATSSTPTDRCETCRYWFRGDVNATAGQCRAAPPATGADGTSSWPIVSAEDWCGKHAAAGPRFDPEALSDALNAFSDAAGNFTDSLSRGVTGFFSRARDAREQSRENKARSLANDTRQLSTLLTEYIISWTNLPESDRSKVCDELTVVADEFLLSVGRPDSASAIEHFLNAENQPDADRNRALAIDYLGLLEKSHRLLLRVDDIPKFHRDRFMAELAKTVNMFQHDVYPLMIPHPFGQRWTWSRYRHL